MTLAAATSQLSPLHVPPIREKKNRSKLRALCGGIHMSNKGTIVYSTATPTPLHAIITQSDLLRYSAELVYLMLPPIPRASSSMDALMVAGRRAGPTQAIQ